MCENKKSNHDYYIQSGLQKSQIITRCSLKKPTNDLVDNALNYMVYTRMSQWYSYKWPRFERKGSYAVVVYNIFLSVE